MFFLACLEFYTLDWGVDKRETCQPRTRALYQRAMNSDLEAFRRIVETRRSVRVYDGTPIPAEVVRDCLDLALLAPNSSNLQAWEFYWVRTPELRKRLDEACLGQPAAKTAAEIIVVVGRTGTWWRNRRLMLQLFASEGDRIPKGAWDYYRKLVPVVYSQGPLSLWGWVKRLFVTVFGWYRPIPREPMSHSDMKTWAAKSASLAAENLMLAFRAHGFDTCPMEGLDSARVSGILKLPRDAFVVMAISAGKRSPRGVYGPRVRFDRKLFVKEI